MTLWDPEKISTPEVLSPETYEECITAIYGYGDPLLSVCEKQYRGYKSMETGAIHEDGWMHTVEQVLIQSEQDPSCEPLLYALTLAINDHETMEPERKRELIGMLLPKATYL